MLQEYDTVKRIFMDVNLNFTDSLSKMKFERLEGKLIYKKVNLQLAAGQRP